MLFAVQRSCRGGLVGANLRVFLDAFDDLLELFDPGAGVGLLFGDGQLTAVTADEGPCPGQCGGQSGLEPDEVDQVQEQP